MAHRPVALVVVDLISVALALTEVA